MIRWAIYRPDGRIDRIYQGTPQEAALQPQGDEDLVPIYEPQTDANAYVLNGTVTERQPFPVTVDKTTLSADGVDEVVVSGVPMDTAVTWPDGQTDTVTDGEVRFSVDLVGTYTLKFSAVAYLDQEVTLEAVAAA